MIIGRIAEINGARHNGSPVEFKPQKLVSSIDFNKKYKHPLYLTIQKAWASNGDMISMQYTGTESNNTRVTIQNKQGFIGKLEQWQVGIARYH